MTTLTGWLASSRTFVVRCATFGLAIGAMAAPALVAQETTNTLPPPAIAVDLLLNPDLNGSLQHWTVIGNVTYDSAEDQGGDTPHSGVAKAAEVPGQAASIEQCVNLPSFWRSVQLKTSFFTRAFTANGAAMEQLQFFDGQNCTGNFLSQLQEKTDFASSTYIQVPINGLNPPLTSQSVAVSFFALNEDQSKPATALLDSFFFGYNIVPGTCGADPTILCVDQNRFQVTATFDLPCATGSNTADGVQDTGTGGFLWCFDPTNPELFVKVLNACTPSEGDTYWVFISGLTNVGLSITVTDTKTGLHKTYTNPPNNDFVPVFDTVGIKGCPTA